MESASEHASPPAQAEPYWVQSRRPLASLLFILPLLVIYEVGVLWCGVRPNGADAFMRRLIEMLGFGQHLLLPGLIVGILLGWHYVSHAPWRVSGGVLSAMAVESIVLGLCLRAIAFVHQSIFSLDIGGMVHSVREAADKTVGFLGAGIYEELLFRLILLSLLAWLFRRAGTAPAMSMIAAALLISLLFAAAHHVGVNGEPFCWFAFTFRFLAGMFFSIVFVYRGFGIAAGSHAAYDIMVGVL
jgi:membrane protease YdiL (CAAX protease family)